MSAETELRAALLAELRDDTDLAGALNGVFEERPVAATPPYAVLTESLALDWSAKGFAGRELRIALTLHVKGGDPGRLGDLTAAAEQAVLATPPQLTGHRIVTLHFARARTGRDGADGWATLIEFRAKVEAT